MNFINYYKMDKVLFYINHGCEGELKKMQDECEHPNCIQIKVGGEEVNECLFCSSIEKHAFGTVKINGTYTEEQRKEMINFIRAKYDCNTAPKYNVDKEHFTKEIISQEIDKAVNEVLMEHYPYAFYQPSSINNRMLRTLITGKSIIRALQSLNLYSSYLSTIAFVSDKKLVDRTFVNHIIKILEKKMSGDYVETQKGSLLNSNAVFSSCMGFLREIIDELDHNCCLSNETIKKIDKLAKELPIEIDSEKNIVL
jgi:hypothetical protein